MDDPGTSVWNRACDYDFQAPREGDRLLKAVIGFDGLAQNGGLGHALDVADEAETQEALRGFRHFGLADVANVVEAAIALDDEDDQEAMSDEYYDAVEPLLATFEKYYPDHADEFAPPNP